MIGSSFLVLFVQVHYGFVLKTTYDDSVDGARLMASGIATREDGVIDGRFYFHLGDALTRLGRSQEARQVIGSLYFYLNSPHSARSRIIISPES